MLRVLPRRSYLCVVIAAALTACASPKGPERGLPEGQPMDAGESAGGRLIVDQLEEQLADVEAKLNLTPVQQPLWDRYEEQIGAFMADQMRVELAPSGKNTAPSQIERKVAVVRNRLTALEEISESARRLYERLNPEQRAMADRLLPGTVPALYSGFGRRASSADKPRPVNPAADIKPRRKQQPSGY